MKAAAAGKKAASSALGGMAIQSLWQRASRTLLTLTVIGLTVGAIIAIDAVDAGLYGAR